MSKSAEHAAEDLQATLAGISTKDLVDELSKRDGVKEIVCPDPESAYAVGIDRSDGEETHISPGNGPARILVVID
jgi:hypothetical protein